MKTRPVLNLFLMFIAMGQYALISAEVNAQNITTIAGNGVQGYNGDSIPATSASLFLPLENALDAFGNLYIADQVNHRVRKVTPAGIITTVAGNGVADFSGDGGPATSASLYYPSGVLVKANGEIYITDRLNNRIRKIGTNGIISTVAGNGAATFSGDGGPATNGSLRAPFSIAFDALGNMYIADGGNRRVRKVNASGIISTVAGNGSTGYAGDGGLATDAVFSNPQDVAVDAAGDLYILDGGNNCIRKVYRNGYIGPWGYRCVALFDGLPHLNRLSGPTGISFDSIGNLYVADLYNARILRFNTLGYSTVVAGNGISSFSGDGGLATSATLSWPTSVSVGSNGAMFISDAANQRIRKVAVPTAAQSVQQLYIDVLSWGQIRVDHRYWTWPSLLSDAGKLLADSSSRNDQGACGNLDIFINQVESNVAHHNMDEATGLSFVMQAEQAKSAAHCR